MGVCCNAATCPGMFQPAPPSFVVPTIGKWLLGLVTLEAFGLIALSAVLFAIHDAATNTGVIYATLGVYCVVASLYFAYDSVLSENMFQYAACHITLSLFTFFIIFQVFHNPYSLGSAWTASRYAIMGVKIGFQLVYWALALPVYHSFGFYAYKLVGTDIRLTRIYTAFRVFLTLIKYDLFCTLLLFFLVKVYLVTTHSADFIVGIIDIFLSVCICLFGWYCVVNEHRRLTVLFVALLLLHPAYIVFKWWSLYEHPEFMPSNVSYPQFVVLTSLTLFLRLALIISTFRCFRNFDLGLKDDVFTSERFAASGVHAGMSKGAVFLADAEAQLMDGGDTLEYDDGLSFGYPVNKRVAAY